MLSLSVESHGHTPFHREILSEVSIVCDTIVCAQSDTAESSHVVLTPDVEQIHEIISLANGEQLSIGGGAHHLGFTSVYGVQVGLGVRRRLEGEKREGLVASVTRPEDALSDLPMTLGS